MNLNHTNLFATCVKKINCFLNSIANRAHSNNYSVGILCAIVVEKLIIGTELFINHIHIHLGCCNSVIIILIASLSVLEEYITVFGRATKNRSFRIERSCTECLNIIHIHHRFEFIIIPNFNLLNFVRSTESVKEMQKRHSALKC